MNALVWLYIINSTLLICHEIESAYWREWELFALGRGRSGMVGFVASHIPVVLLLLYGLIETYNGTGKVFSIILAACGIFAFFIHLYFRLQGDQRFNTPLSWTMLSAALIASCAQMVLAMGVV